MRMILHSVCAFLAHCFSKRTPRHNLGSRHGAFHTDFIADALLLGLDYDVDISAARVAARPRCECELTYSAASRRRYFPEPPMPAPEFGPLSADGIGIWLATLRADARYYCRCTIDVIAHAAL